ncbi:hypothetical protein PP180_14710 [Muricauda sp. SK9]|uniref:hypothetical protein n=1 Tax=Flavobacteriaceae TaxID=49546 RepID=UPI0016018B70|nr:MULTISPECIES: hypothetical protein [Allomuricauda]MDC6386634.1 hypothetical protein [Muricauda sp. SK9]
MRGNISQVEITIQIVQPFLERDHRGTGVDKGDDYTMILVDAPAKVQKKRS